MAKQPTCKYGRDGAWALILLLLVSSFLYMSSCSLEKSLVVESPVSFTGTWEGILNGYGLWMELNEAENGIITGYVIFSSPYSTDTLAIESGEHLNADSLYLDVLNPIGPPIGCDEVFYGRSNGPDRLSGDCYIRCGHDPLIIKEWTVNRQP
jgi:hypothetical protein